MTKRRTGYSIILLMCIVVVVAAAVIAGGKNANSVQKPAATQLASASAPVADAAADPEPTPTPVPTAKPNNGVPDISQKSPADDGFFSDSVFVGNSLVDGLYLYGGVSTCRWLSGTGVSIYNIETQKVSDKQGGEYTVMEGLSSHQYAKVYILLGINEIGSSAESFAESYGKLIDKIRAYQPTADIYLMSLTPVTAKKSSDGGYFTRSRIEVFNGVIHQLCADKNCWYLDDYTPLAGSDGYLPADASSDGIHFKPSYYPKWMDVIRTHYV